MRLPVKDMDIATGSVPVVILNSRDARKMDLHHGDRLLLTKGRRTATAILDIADSEKAVPHGHIGLFEEVLKSLDAKNNDFVTFFLARKPDSVLAIRRKLDGHELTEKEIFTIVKDIVEDSLTDVELTSFVTGNYARGMTMKEVVFLTKAMAGTGLRLSFGKKPIIDIHSIGGVPGNRTTPIIVAIVAAAGLTIPKTSSRAITSPAGTADMLEVLTSVVLSKEKLEQLIATVGGFMVWGGTIALAPADDKIIAIEHPLNIDAEGQMLASIMAKKVSVGATRLLLEIPLDTNGKVSKQKHAMRLKNQFCTLGKKLGIAVHVIVTDGSQPVGNGIGPALEARDVIWVLTDDKRGPEDLREKSLIMAGKTLEMGGRKNGYALAKKLLESGAAYAKFVEIINAQGGARIVTADKVPLSQFTHHVRAWTSGKIVSMNNHIIAQIAKDAGAPADAGSGMYLHAHVGDIVKKGDILYTLYTHNHVELGYALTTVKKDPGIVIQ